MKILDDGICSVESIKANGYRMGKYGVMVIYHENCTAAAVYTRNKVYAAPIDVTREHIGDGNISAVIVNSGNANCYTGKEGYRNAVLMAEIAADYLDIPVSDVAVASTGVIGRQLPMDIIESVAVKSLEGLDNSRENATCAAEAILTTDTVIKECAVESELGDGTRFRVAGICKGSGMIAPNMGTMLGFITTALKFSRDDLQEMLRASVNRSFNMVIVDGDTSTNDTVIVMSTGEVEGVVDKNFSDALDYVCISLAGQIAGDGEGAEHFLEVECTGVGCEEDAISISRSVVSSSLVKTAVFGADPNWGRIITAMGYAGVEFDPDNVSISISSGDESACFIDKGVVLTFDDPSVLERAEEIMKNRNIRISISLNMGDYSATAYGCDLTYDYVKINADYTT